MPLPPATSISSPVMKSDISDAWVILGLSAIIFSIKKKSLAQALPGGPTLLAVFGFLSMIAMSITFYYAATNAAIGPFSAEAQGVLGAIFASGFVIYVISYYY